MMKSALAAKLREYGEQLRSSHENDFIAPGVEHPALADAALVIKGAEEIEKNVSDRISLYDRFVNPPMTVVETDPDSVRDARRWRAMASSAWWKRIAVAIGART